jgi:molybdopterin converting factor small subunit
MQNTVLFFGALTDICGNSALSCEASTVAETIEKMNSRYPALRQATYVVAVNQKISEDHSLPLEADSEIAFLPPFAGG